MTQLYRHYCKDGKLLYVGISFSAVKRLSEHSDKKWFNDITNVEIENYPNRDLAIEAEAEAIKTERPLYNVQHNRGHEHEIDSQEEIHRLKVRIERLEKIVGMTEDQESNERFGDILTLSQAARASGKSKSVLHRAVDKGKLSASRNSDGSYAIKIQDLYKMYPECFKQKTGILHRAIERLRPTFLTT